MFSPPSCNLSRFTWLIRRRLIRWRAVRLASARNCAVWRCAGTVDGDRTWHDYILGRIPGRLETIWLHTHSINGTWSHGTWDQCKMELNKIEWKWKMENRMKNDNNRSAWKESTAVTWMLTLSQIEIAHESAWRHIVLTWLRKRKLESNLVDISCWLIYTCLTCIYWAIPPALLAEMV